MLIWICVSQYFFNLSVVNFDTIFSLLSFSTGLYFNITSLSLFQLFDLVWTRTTCSHVAVITEPGGSLKNSRIFQFGRAWFEGRNVTDRLKVEHVREGLDRENFPDRRRFLLVDLRDGPCVALVFIAGRRCAVRRILTSRREDRGRRNRRCERRDRGRRRVMTWDFTQIQWIVIVLSLGFLKKVYFTSEESEHAFKIS